MAFRPDDLVVRRGTTEPVMRVAKVEILATGAQRVSVEWPDEDPRNDYMFERRYLSHRLELAPEGAVYMPETSWVGDLITDMVMDRVPPAEHLTGYERAMVERDRSRLARSQFRIVH